MTQRDQFNDPQLSQNTFASQTADQAAKSAQSTRVHHVPSRMVRYGCWDLAAFIAAVLFAGMMCVSTLFMRTDVLAIASTRADVIAAVQSGIITGIVSYIIMLLIFRWADWAVVRHASSRYVAHESSDAAVTPSTWLKICTFFRTIGQRQPGMPMRTAMRRRFGWYWLIVLICWLPWIIVCWPGALRDDTIAQMLQSTGIHWFYTQHPLFDTLVFGAFWKLGQAFGNIVIGLAIYIVLQAIALSAVSAFLLSYIAKLGAPRIVQFLSIVFLAVGYPVAASVVTMGKDTIFTIFEVPFAVLFVEICRTRGALLQRRSCFIWFMVFGALSIMSKRTALVIILCSGIVLIFAARRHFKRVIIAILVPVVAATCIWDPLATAATHAEVSESREIYGVVTQIAALVEKENPDGITEQERTALNKFMNLEHAAKEVSSTRTDETFHTLKSDASTADTLAAIKAVAAITARNPKLAAIAYLGTVYDWGNLHFSYRYPMNSQYTFTNVYMDQWASYWPNYNADNVDMPKAVAFFSPWTDAYNNMPSWQKRVQQHIQKFLKAHKGNPFLSLALYVTYIPLAALLYLLTRKRWYALAAFSFMAFTVLSVYASPMALFWYAIPVYFILPLFTALPFVRFNADPAEVSAAIESSETANIPTDVQAE